MNKAISENAEECMAGFMHNQIKMCEKEIHNVIGERKIIVNGKEDIKTQCLVNLVYRKERKW